MLSRLFLLRFQVAHLGPISAGLTYYVVSNSGVLIYVLEIWVTAGKYTHSSSSLERLVNEG
jgi:hypothetical protein